MPVCCGSSGTPFVQTRFLGASVVRFSSQVDWNGTGGGLQIELAEDLCNGDAFNPPGVGSPVFFSMGGFTHGGILQNWKQTDNATGAKTYLVNVTSPRELVAGCNVILSSYNGPVYGVPNLANVHGWLEATYGNPCVEAGFTGTIPGMGANLTYPPAPGFGGAQHNEVGTPWQLILTALNNILNGFGGAYGGPISFRGATFLIDLSELPLLTGDIRIGGENMTLEDLIAQVCALGGVEYFYDLIQMGGAPNCAGGVTNIIKLRTSIGSWQSNDQGALNIDQACGSQIDARLSLGTIGGAIAASSCINRHQRGIELRHEVTNAFISGEFRQDIWQMPYSGNCDGWTDTIWPYWGKNPDGTVIMGDKCGDGSFSPNKDDPDHGHNFTAITSHLGIGISTWKITMLELRAALAGRGEWEAWLFMREPTKYAQLAGKSEEEIVDSGHIATVLALALNAEDADAAAADEAGFKGVDAHAFGAMAKDLASLDKDQYWKAGVMYDYVREFAQEYFGRKFMVKLPFLCKRFNSSTPWTLETNWECTDSGWTEWSVLGIPNNHWVLDQFRADDGKVKCFVKYQSTKPMKLDKLSKNDCFAVDPYNLYVSATADEIVWVTPNDARAVITVSGPVQQENPHGILPEWILGFGIIGDYTGDPEKYNQFVQSISNDKFCLGMEEPFLMPIAAAVPLQSRRLVYGPWFANTSGSFNFFGGGSLFSGSDSGKTVYQRESGFAPWHFGNFYLMDWVAYNTAVSMLGDKYVIESGEITFPGAPTGSLGALIAANGPIVSHIDVQVGRGNAAVTTTYRMKTHTPDQGKLAKKRLDQIRHALQVGIKADRMFRKHALERLRNLHDIKLQQQLLALKPSIGMSGRSSHEMVGGQAMWDPTSPSLDTTTVQEQRHRHNKPPKTVDTEQPTKYEEPDYDDEPHGRSVAAMSEGRKDVRALRGDLPHRYRRAAWMEQIGLFRPFSTLPHNQKAANDDAYFMAHWRDETNKDKIMCTGDDAHDKFPPQGGCPKDWMKKHAQHFSHEQLPPIYCQEHHLPINVTTLSPFLAKGRSLLPGWSNGGICLTKSPDSSKGHDIEYIARDGVYPAHMSIRHAGDDYSSQHWYRGVALRGPLVIAGWGFDIDNKPVPNESTSYPNNPKMKFEQDWLRKPQKWMCGPVDLRWDYKRHVWTAPSPMKIVKLELMETLCTGGKANAILYDDQEQYDYDGNALTCEGGCGTKQGYKVKVWGNSMYPVPAGWRIMAHYDTTHDRYQMINHDPLPIVEATIIDDMLCVDGWAVIDKVAGECALDPCGIFPGMLLKLQNGMNQPLCAPRKVYAWICGFECNPGGGDNGPTWMDCYRKSDAPLYAKGIILQAEFKPDCVVTHLELLEYYCWGYDISCDEEDIEIWSQGDVETCWDWCLNLDAIGCVDSYTGYVFSDTHSHTAEFSGTVSGTVSGEISSVTISFADSGTLSFNIPSSVISGWTTEDSHSHTASFVGSAVSTDVTLETQPYTLSGNGVTSLDGAHSFTFHHSHTVNMSGTSTFSGTTSPTTADISTAGGTITAGTGTVDGTITAGTFDGVTDWDTHSHVCSFTADVSGTIDGTTDDFTASGCGWTYYNDDESISGTTDEDSRTHSFTFSGTIDGTCTGDVNDFTIWINDDTDPGGSFTVSGTLSGGTHSHTGTFSGTFEDTFTTETGPITISGTGTTDNDGDWTDTFAISGGAHTHPFSYAGTVSGNISGTTEDITLSGNGTTDDGGYQVLSGTTSEDSRTHSFTFSGTIDGTCTGDVNDFTIWINDDTDMAGSWTASATLSGGAHSHTGTFTGTFEDSFTGTTDTLSVSGSGNTEDDGDWTDTFTTTNDGHSHTVNISGPLTGATCTGDVNDFTIWINDDTDMAGSFTLNETLSGGAHSHTGTFDGTFDESFTGTTEAIVVNGSGTTDTDGDWTDTFDTSSDGHSHAVNISGSLTGATCAGDVHDFTIWINDDTDMAGSFTATATTTSGAHSHSVDFSGPLTGATCTGDVNDFTIWINDDTDMAGSFTINETLSGGAHSHTGTFDGTFDESFTGTTENIVVNGSGTTDSDGDWTDTFTTTNDGHSHAVTISGSLTGATCAGDVHDFTIWINDDTDPAGSFTINETLSGGAHSHTGTFSQTFSGTTEDISVTVSGSTGDGGAASWTQNITPTGSGTLGGSATGNVDNGATTVTASGPITGNAEGNVTVSGTTGGGGSFTVDLGHNHGASSVTGTFTGPVTGGTVPVSGSTGGGGSFTIDLGHGHTGSSASISLTGSLSGPTADGDVQITGNTDSDGGETITVSGTPVVDDCEVTGGGGQSTYDVDGASCTVSCSVGGGEGGSGSGSGGYCDCDVSCGCSITGGTVTVDFDDGLAGIDCVVTMGNSTFTGSSSDHNHPVDITETVSLPVTGSVTVSGNFTPTVNPHTGTHNEGNHTHTVNLTGNLSGATATTSGSINVSVPPHTGTHNEGNHTHTFTGTGNNTLPLSGTANVTGTGSLDDTSVTIDSFGSVTCTLNIDPFTVSGSISDHQHPVNLAGSGPGVGVSGSIAGPVTITGSGEHTHTLSASGADHQHHIESSGVVSGVTFDGTVTGGTVSGTGSTTGGDHDHDVTVSAPTHDHPFSFTADAGSFDVSGTISGTVSGPVTISGAGTHTHTLNASGTDHQHHIESSGVVSGVTFDGIVVGGTVSGTATTTGGDHDHDVTISGADHQHHIESSGVVSGVTFDGTVTGGTVSGTGSTTGGDHDHSVTVSAPTHDHPFSFTANAGSFDVSGTISGTVSGPVTIVGSGEHTHTLNASGADHQHHIESSGIVSGVTFDGTVVGGTVSGTGSTTGGNHDHDVTVSAPIHNHPFSFTGTGAGVDFSGTVSGTVSGPVTISGTGTHTHTVSLSGSEHQHHIESSGIVSGVTFDGTVTGDCSGTGTTSQDVHDHTWSGVVNSHVHTFDFTGSGTGVDISGTFQGNYEGSGTTEETTHSHTVQVTAPVHSHSFSFSGTGASIELSGTVSGVVSGPVTISGDGTHTHTFTASGTDHIHHIESSGIVSGVTFDGTVTGDCSGTGTTAQDVHDHEFSFVVPQHRHSFCVNVSGEGVDIDGTFSGTISGTTECTSYTHRHSFTGNLTDQTFEGTVDFTGVGITITTGTLNLPAMPVSGTSTWSGTGTTNETIMSSQVLSHQHTFSWQGTIPSQTLSGTFSAPISGTVTTGSDTHSHRWSAVLPTHQLSGNLSFQASSVHSHPIELEFSGEISGEVEIHSDTHNHSFTLPCREVNVCLDAKFDLDIDSRFVPGKCTIRIAMLNKNFWEYYWYELCICTRAIWHEAEMGPATCAINETPDCIEECEAIECDDPTYECSSSGERKQYTLAEGEDVSWFGFANDSTLLDTQTNCVEEQGIMGAAASCPAVNAGTGSDCCNGSCVRTINLDGGGQTQGQTIEQDGALSGYCPSGNPASFQWGAFQRDLDAGLFDQIGDAAQDHVPEGAPPGP